MGEINFCSTWHGAHRKECSTGNPSKGQLFGKSSPPGQRSGSLAWHAKGLFGRGPACFPSTLQGGLHFRLLTYSILNILCSFVGTSVSYSYHSLKGSPQSSPTRKLPLTLQIHWRCQLHSQAHVRRQSFMVLLHFCTSCKRGTSCTLFWTISSTVFVRQVAMEDRNGASFWSKGQTCLLTIIKDLGS